MLVSGMGNSADASVMIVGSVPNALAAINGQPYAGPQWKVLGTLMDMAGLSVVNSYITMVIKDHDNRSPKVHEIDEALPSLREEWASVGKPRVLVALGIIPLHALVRSEGPIVSLPKAMPIKVMKKTVVFYMYDPQTVMSRPDLFAQAEQHWRGLGKYLREKGIN